MPKKKKETANIQPEQSPENQLYQACFNYVVQNAESILYDFNRVKGFSSKDRAAYEFLFEHFGCIIDGRNRPNDNGPKYVIAEAIVAAKQAAGNFVTNVFPPQTQNFLLQTTAELTNSYSFLYHTPPPAVAAVFKAINFQIPEVDIEESDIESKINSALQYIAEVIQQKIDDSNFGRQFIPNIIRWMIRDWVTIVQKDSSGEGIVFKQINPFSVYIDYNEEQEVVGVYRGVLISIRDFHQAYSNAIAEPKHSTDDKYAQVNLYECVIRIVINAQVQWIRVIYDLNKTPVVFDLLPFNPYIIFSEELPPGSNVGRGRIMSVYQRLRCACEEQKVWDKALLLHSKPPIMYDYARVQLYSDDPKEAFTEGNLIPVESLATPVIMPVPTPDITTLKETLIADKEFIVRTILGEQINTDPRTTATLTNAQLAERANFNTATQWSVVYSFVKQLVQKTFLLLKSEGVIQNNLYYFLTQPKDLLPEWLKQFREYIMDKQISESGGKEDLLNIYEWVVREFIETMIQYAGDLGRFTLSVVSPVGMQKKINDQQKTNAAIQIVANVVGSTDFVHKERFEEETFDNMGVDRKVCLTSKEKEELAKAQTQILQQQQAQAMLAQTQKEKK